MCSHLKQKNQFTFIYFDHKYFIYENCQQEKKTKEFNLQATHKKAAQENTCERNVWHGGTRITSEFVLKQLFLKTTILRAKHWVHMHFPTQCFCELFACHTSHGRIRTPINEMLSYIQTKP